VKIRAIRAIRVLFSVSTSHPTAVFPQSQLLSVTICAIRAIRVLSFVSISHPTDVFPLYQPLSVTIRAIRAIRVLSSVTIFHPTAVFPLFQLLSVTIRAIRHLCSIFCDQSRVTHTSTPTGFCLGISSYVYQYYIWLEYKF